MSNVNKCAPQEYMSSYICTCLICLTCIGGHILIIMIGIYLSDVARSFKFLGSIISC